MSGNKELYYQCELKRPTLTGNEVQVSWIPEEFAVAGRAVDLKEGDVWDKGWIVSNACGVSLDHETLRERSQDYKRTRKASDI